jgi:hypothetical protein
MPQTIIMSGSEPPGTPAVHDPNQELDAKALGGEPHRAAGLVAIGGKQLGPGRRIQGLARLNQVHHTETECGRQCHEAEETDAGEQPDPAEPAQVSEAHHPQGKRRHDERHDDHDQRRQPHATQGFSQVSDPGIDRSPSAGERVHGDSDRGAQQQANQNSMMGRHRGRVYRLCAVRR